MTQGVQGEDRSVETGDTWVSYSLTLNLGERISWTLLCVRPIFFISACQWWESQYIPACQWWESQHIPACQWWEASHNFLNHLGIFLVIFTISVLPDTADIHCIENQAYSFPVGKGGFCFHPINYRLFWKLPKKECADYNWLWKNCFIKIQLNVFEQKYYFKDVCQVNFNKNESYFSQ